MRGFIVLWFSALTVAAPQGYNYQQGGGYQSITPSFQPQQPQILQSQYSAPQQRLIGSVVESSIGNINSQFAQQYAGSASLSSLSGSHQTSASVQKPEVIVSKRFFIHSAPEERDEEYKEKVLTVGTPRKNYNVLFIRAPSKSSKKATIKIVPAVNEEKTVIYVLSKKNEATDIDAHVQELPATTSKPEVYFIKYKTPEEAAHAQKKIQAEYDSLGGSTQVSNEGIAPISSVIGVLEDKARLAEQQAAALASSSSHAGSVGTSSNAHLSQEILTSGSASASASSSSAASNTYLPPNYYY